MYINVPNQWETGRVREAYKPFQKGVRARDSRGPDPFWKRLLTGSTTSAGRGLKRKYDPANFFRRNKDIAPAGA